MGLRRPGTKRRRLRSRHDQGHGDPSYSSDVGNLFTNNYIILELNIVIIHHTTHQPQRETAVNNSDDNEQLQYEDRLQNRLKILVQMINDGKIFFNEGLQVVESLKAIRQKADGTFDLSTVDSLVRSTALATEHIHYRTESKKSISLREIQNMYFTFLWNQFEHLYTGMRKQSLTPHQVARFYVSDKKRVNEFLPLIEQLLENIKTFWDHAMDPNQFHIEDLPSSSKGVFGGDLFPSNQESIASKCSIFIDTIILPDPFLRSIIIFESSPPEKKVYYAIKHALNILQYMDLACADLPIPIIAILPDKAALQADERDFFFELGKQDATILGGLIYGRQFSSFEEFLHFSEKLTSIEKVVSALKSPSHIIFDTEWGHSPTEQLQRALKDDLYQSFCDNNPGFLIANQALSRMAVNNELLLKSRQLNGIPIIDAPTSWKYLTIKLSLDAKFSEQFNNITNLHVTRALNSLSEHDLPWLGKIPHDAIIELRTSGAIEEIRSILGKGIDELATSNPDDFARTTDQVFYNMTDAFSAHQKAIDELKSKKWKFAGEQISSWIALGAIEITAAATGYPVWGLGAFIADQLLPIPKLKDIPSSIQNLIDSSRELHRSPVGMFFGMSKNGEPNNT